MILLVALLSGLGLFLGVLAGLAGLILGSIFVVSPFVLLSAGGLALQVLNFLFLFISTIAGGFLGLLSFI
ncbi:MULTISPECIES: hypothetical protein [Archaeoglobus]|jgi:hypothetical protein|uniref:Uncharacterized protein n=2 Tax=Archaeoglobus fulgidus TaxID=2234 RepID=A0A075WJG9_ARCFL|nr:MULTISPECIES: hypothetical protein [Archaeoglobus]AIG97718.1 hypothetical protein AFULGI_00009260 [Archaeoglobus fulgidus DSM 8774]KUJ93689.1 MAG: hypothetical protein XD40_1082 [Archaeoglobus fulgidus]MDI3497520.1 hypothetical protein [Archaeoglobus sp.]